MTRSVRGGAAVLFLSAVSTGGPARADDMPVAPAAPESAPVAPASPSAPSAPESAPAAPESAPSAPESAPAAPPADTGPQYSGGLGLTLLASVFDDTGRTLPWEGDSLTNETRPLHAIGEFRLPGVDDRLWLSFRGTLGYTRSEIEPVNGAEPVDEDGQRTTHGDGRTWRWGLRGGLRYVLDATPTWHFATYGLAGFDRLSRVKHEEYLTNEGPASSAEAELVQSVSLTVGMMAERPLAHGISFRLWFDALDVRYLLEGHSSDLSDDDGTATLGDRTELGAALNLLAELAYAF